MNPYPLLTAAALLLAPCVADAATYSVVGGNANFGRTGGIYMLFSSTGVAPAMQQNWGNTTPQDGASYSIDSLSVVKNNVGPGSSPTNLWVGVYTSFTGGGTSAELGGFLGASSNSVGWAAAAAGSTITWNFESVIATAAPAHNLYFIFQTSAASREGLPALSLAAENDISIRRLANTGTYNGGAHTFANQGSSIIQDTTGGLRSDRIPVMSLDITLVPEPSHSLVAVLMVTGLLGQRRRR